MNLKNKFKGANEILLIAEIGGNHEGDFEYAKKLVQLAVNTPVDYVKLQIYTGDSLVNPLESPDRNKHFKRFELSQSQYYELAKTVVESGKKFTASIWESAMFDWVDEFMSIYKIGSGDLTAYSVIKKIVERQKPIVLSTGLATENEVLETIQYIQSLDRKYCNPDYLAVLQCTSMYPIQHSDANLSVIQRYKEKTGLTVGYSDHTEGLQALLYAVAFGAEILEFHFTDSREGKQFRDHKVSLIPEEVHQLVDGINFINTLKGNSEKKPIQVEIENGHVTSFRRAVYPAKDIPEGKIIEESDLICLRPNHGMDAREFFNIVGKKAKTNLTKHQKLQMNLFE